LSHRADAEWLALNRRIKAAAFVRVIDAAGLRPTPAEVRAWVEKTWTIITDLANRTEAREDGKQYSKPSPSTVALVADILEKREELVASTRSTYRGKSTHAQIVRFKPVPVPEWKRVAGHARSRRASIVPGRVLT